MKTTLLNHRNVSIALLTVQSFILLYIFATWYKFKKNLSEHGGEMADGIFGLLLIFATVYYLVITVWTYRVYKNPSPKLAGFQLGLIFIFSILTAIILLFKIYF
ncbi:MAG: hypothetical protein IPH28_24910 [Cytophagaceae bacterium]|jgi:hypothetical protein|nr:hypothetical protein [Cytophagaceae bacterium]MBK9510432.1 hypothetical protein [Cytophagaceae bacterium]MBK9935975.1 hypothetical protein [Cytophagaceae bacterium]MBL0304142.1 hypothetical protein [Cytophagaceae bacterium]MBL0326951.1 hypothetical protein [Cytophagaceae bacterium]